MVTRFQGTEQGGWESLLLSIYLFKFLWLMEYHPVFFFKFRLLAGDVLFSLEVVTSADGHFVFLVDPRI